MISKSLPVRFGGQEIDGHFRFELSGGALALDFVNTLDERPRGGLERLTSYDRLLDWSHQAGVADDAKAERIRTLATANGTAARAVLADAIGLREAMFTTIQDAIAGEPPTAVQLRELNRWVAVGARSRRLVGGSRGELAWQTHLDLDRLDFMLPAIVESLGEVLSEAAAFRVKICGASECDWVFVDRSRRGNRIWCDMSVCGNRAKARRHHIRTRKRAAIPGTERAPKAGEATRPAD